MNLSNTLIYSGKICEMHGGDYSKIQQLDLPKGVKDYLAEYRFKVGVGRVVGVMLRRWRRDCASNDGDISRMFAFRVIVRKRRRMHRNEMAFLGRKSFPVFSWRPETG